MVQLVQHQAAHHNRQSSGGFSSSSRIVSSTILSNAWDISGHSSCIRWQRTHRPQQTLCARKTMDRDSGNSYAMNMRSHMQLPLELFSLRLGHGTNSTLPLDDICNTKSVWHSPRWLFQWNLSTTNLILCSINSESRFRQYLCSEHVKSYTTTFRAILPRVGHGTNSTLPLDDKRCTTHLNDWSNETHPQQTLHVEKIANLDSGSNCVVSMWNHTLLTFGAILPRVGHDTNFTLPLDDM